MADEDRELAEEMALLHAETFDTTPSDNLSTCHQAAALAVYRRGRADLLSELKAVLGPFLEDARETEWDDRARQKNTWFIDDAVIKKLLALVPAEAGE